ncbi:MAG: bifunctional 3,4-dihydroxy-2-butanone-4-phosphate synthase/GTP cyclohydrolase II [Planctomycetota bacterium]|jgi:3,4-dihydroxy 2-butanone 4-phosphate synthase/GTP cyclohydrolase II|nr:bifunctional 3,4-dihydroxy-2-butanone-4-phosphate synthase/GTP cyclohydrolase II [Planctomycetota bacterium]MDP6838277.1 bifunctional 3,4-dihydroxy-2-butanone-4-phosphate synthase/GTP cyclohydrolase II [Planctomycetota bacterium]
MAIHPIPEILADLRAGKMIILVDDPSRENEGDLAMLAEHVTPEAINFMAREGRGLICMPMEEAMCERLELAPQVEKNTSKLETGFTVSIEAATGVTTGISAADRARTVQVACDPASTADDLARPGHVFPLRARDGGVLCRGGQTEGMVDLARLCESSPSGVICEIMNDDGTMARMPDLERFAERHELKICTIADIISYRRKNERLVEPLEMDTPIPTPFGMFQAHLFRSELDGKEHVALTRGMPGPGLDGPREAMEEPVWVRVHSECLTGDVFHSLRCDCGAQLDKALEILGSKDHAILVYMRQEGRGIGLENKLKAYRLQDEGLDTVEANQALGFGADLREYGLGAQILHYLGVRRMHLLTNNPKKIHGLAGYGLQIEDQVPLRTTPNSMNHRYLQTKRDKLGHIMDEVDDVLTPADPRE